MKTTLLFLLLYAFSCLTLQGQVLVNGQVKSADGELLLGVNVSENGTTNGTATDIDGNFSLEISNPNAVLHFSYIGYSSLNVEVSGQTTLQVIMEEGVVIGEVQVVGSRSYNRTMTNSPVAVDIIDVANLTSTNGRVEINQILQYAAPSFNATKQSGSDGADHVDPASLRGMGPDQTLVLINGKRRHQSSLVNIFGTRVEIRELTSMLFLFQP